MGGTAAKEGVMTEHADQEKRKPGLIGLQDAADYLGCSHQYLGQILNKDEDDHPLKDYFRHYAGRWRTTYALLDEYFTNSKIMGTKRLSSDEASNVDRQTQGVP